MCSASDVGSTAITDFRSNEKIAPSSRETKTTHPHWVKKGVRSGITILPVPTKMKCYLSADEIRN